jgi:hypothetical protein
MIDPLTSSSSLVARMAGKERKEWIHVLSTRDLEANGARSIRQSHAHPDCLKQTVEESWKPICHIIILYVKPFFVFPSSFWISLSPNL